MTRRILIVVIIGTATALGILEPPPAPTVDPFAGPPSTPGLVVCPWLIVNDTSTSSLAQFAAEAVSYPDIGEPDQIAPTAVANPTRQGEFGAMIEGEGASAQILTAGPDGQAAAMCTDPTPRVWYLPGGSTREGESLALHLSNPFPTDAAVSVRSASELGVDTDPSLESLTVPARSHRVIHLDTRLELRDWLAITVEIRAGSVVPGLVQTSPTDRAAWTGTQPDEVVFLPALPEVGTLVLMTDSALAVEYDIDTYFAEGSLLSAFSGEIPAHSVVTIPLTSLSSPGGLRVVANGPIAAAAVWGGQTAVVLGSPISENWDIPAIASNPEATYRFHILNPAGSPVEISYSYLGGPPATTSVAAASTRVITLTRPMAGLRITASAPVSIAWTAETEGQLAASRAVPK